LQCHCTRFVPFQFLPYCDVSCSFLRRISLLVVPIKYGTVITVQARWVVQPNRLLFRSIPIILYNNSYYRVFSLSMPPSSSPSPSTTGSGGSDEKKSSSSSWFASWFENDNTNVKDQIHQKLNEFETYQEQNEPRNPFFLPSQYPHSPEHAATGGGIGGGSTTASALQRELEELFESVGFGALADTSRTWDPSMASSSSSSTVSQIGNGTHFYKIMKQENHSGVQIEVQFPEKIDPDQLTVEVLQEYPCVVQWQNGRTWNDQAKLGHTIDCSQLSASISTANNILRIKAPTASSNAADIKTRRIPVTEKDDA
jgi:hypothetical protein